MKTKPPPTIYTYTTPNGQEVIATDPYRDGRSVVYNVSIVGWNCWSRVATGAFVSWMPFGSTANEADAIQWLAGEL